MTGKLMTALCLILLMRCGPAPAPAATSESPAPVTRVEDERPPAPAPPGAGEVDVLLDRIAASAADLDDFQAEVTYVKWDSVLERTETRFGEVIYQVRPGGNARFAILLDRLIVGSRAQDRSKHYVFDGSWLVEIDPQAKQFIKRQVVEPGRRMNPFKLGEGPFPLPIGQLREDVHERYDVSLLEAPLNERLAAWLADKPAHGLLLVPRTDQEDFKQAEVWYDKSTLLPIGICLTEANGSLKIVMLNDPRRNAGIDEAKLSLEEPDPREWQIDVRPWAE